MEVQELETSTRILCSETTTQSMSVVLGINQLVQSLVLNPSSNYNGVFPIDFTISLYPETLSNDTYSSSFTLYIRPVDEDTRLIVSPTAVTDSIGYYSNSLPSISVFGLDFLSACRSEFVGDAADKMSISISLTVDSGYLLVPVLHDFYDGFYVPVSWQRKQTALLSENPPLVNAVLSNIKYLVDGSLKREDFFLINVACNNWIVLKLKYY
jgi:hypothetical protein